MIKEFKDFISKGNILDLAVAVVMATAFNAIVSSLVNNIIMPLICAIFGKNDVTSLSFTLNNSVISYGVFLQAVIDFLLIAITLFIVLKLIMGAKGYSSRIIKEMPTKEEKKELKEMGVNMKNRREVVEATRKLRASKIVEEKITPSTEELLLAILEEIRSQKPATKEAEAKAEESEEKTDEKPAKKSK